MKTQSGKTEDLKVRVPGSLKRAIIALAGDRLSSESEVVRQALLEYLDKNQPGWRAPRPNPSPAPAIDSKLDSIEQKAASAAATAALAQYTPKSKHTAAGSTGTARKSKH